MNILKINFTFRENIMLPFIFEDLGKKKPYFTSKIFGIKKKNVKFRHK